MKKNDNPRSREVRRQLLRAGVALAATGAAGHAVIAGAQSLGLMPTIDDVAMIPLLPEPSQSGIDHVVVVTMENRSFDHYLGWVLMFT